MTRRSRELIRAGVKSCVGPRELLRFTCVGQQKHTLVGYSTRLSNQVVASEGPRRYRPHFGGAICPENGSWRTDTRFH